MNILGFCCVHCQRKLMLGKHGICSRCNKQIDRFNYCGRCGSELAQNALSCGNCMRHEPSWDRMVIVGRYSEPLSILIHRFKFQNQFFLDRMLARLMLLAIRQARREHQLTLPQLIIPVPLHRRRQWSRGYNQAALVGAQLAKWLHIPCRTDLVRRIKHTANQRGLSATMRRNNLKKAFALSGKFAQCGITSVALLDDVITTGSTLNEIAKLLHRHGVEHIQVWGIARA
ncbi:amidophosphoribosyltransferase [Pasteurellaceae bacterium LIM206]|nr:amidophosphoribosyltransferase [Pasteurellaceae bacterium LIM206]